jgi:hypothetical protein
VREIRAERATRRLERRPVSRVRQRGDGDELALVEPGERGIGRRELARLFPSCEVRVTAMTLAPPLARRVVRRAPALATVLAWLPWLRSHHFAAIVP